MPEPEVTPMTWEKAEVYEAFHDPLESTHVWTALCAIALARQERKRAEALERGQLAPITADRTGHLYRCAKINGVWSCAEGCAVKRAETAERVIAESQRIADKWEDAARKEREMAEMYKETALLETGLREAAEAEIHAAKAHAERAEEGEKFWRGQCTYQREARERYQCLYHALKTRADALAEAVEGYITVNKRENANSLFWQERAKFYAQMGERLAAYRAYREGA